MMRASPLRTGLLAVFGLAAISLAPAVHAQEHGGSELPELDWSFEGPFGTFDPAQLQRGFKVYREVCASCHGLDLVSFRNLAQPGGLGYTEEQAAQVASEYQVTDDQPDESGEMVQRDGRLSDRFPSPFPNEQAARASNGGAYPPDLSVIAKAREGGPDYLYALLVGYTDPPEGFELQEGAYYNEYFPGHSILMPPPLSDGQVEYTDGSPATVDQYATDVAAFLMWAAEPKMTERKTLGLQTMAFLAVFIGLLWFTKRKVWSDVEH